MNWTTRFMELLKHGPMTEAELKQVTGLRKRDVRITLGRLFGLGKVQPEPTAFLLHWELIED